MPIEVVPQYRVHSAFNSLSLQRRRPLSLAEQRPRPSSLHQDLNRALYSANSTTFSDYFSGSGVSLGSGRGTVPANPSNRCSTPGCTCSPSPGFGSYGLGLGDESSDNEDIPAYNRFPSHTRKSRISSAYGTTGSQSRSFSASRADSKRSSFALPEAERKRILALRRRLAKIRLHWCRTRRMHKNVSFGVSDQRWTTLRRQLVNGGFVINDQVSRLVCACEGGGPLAAADLNQPVQAVARAVEDLVRVGYETCHSSGDATLQQDMPAALTRVQNSGRLLQEAANQLSTLASSPNRFSTEAGMNRAQASDKLVQGARGILQGTSALLMCFDESEVRKIVKTCKKLLDYIAVSEVIDNMNDLSIFVKDMTPWLQRVCNDCEQRAAELSSPARRRALTAAITRLRAHSPLLVCALKVFLQIHSIGGAGKTEAAENRDFVAQTMAELVHECIRILRMTGTDQSSADPAAAARRAHAACESLLPATLEWLTDPYAPIGGMDHFHDAGEKSTHRLITYAERAAAASLPTDAAAIRRSCARIRLLVEEICDLRARAAGDGMRVGFTIPEANWATQAQAICSECRSLIVHLVGDLSSTGGNQGSQLSAAVAARCAMTVGSMGLRLDRHTGELLDLGVDADNATGVEGTGDSYSTTWTSLEEAATAVEVWARRPTDLDAVLNGKPALSVIFHVAELAGADDVLDANCERLRRLCTTADEKSKTMDDALNKGNDAEATLAGADLSSAVHQLSDVIVDICSNRIINDFADTTTPLKDLCAAAEKPIDYIGRLTQYEDRARALQNMCARCVRTGQLAAATAYSFASVNSSESALPLSTRLLSSSYVAPSATNGGSSSRGALTQANEELLWACDQVRQLTPQVIAAGKIRMHHLNVQASSLHMDNLRTQLEASLQSLRTLANAAAPTVRLVHAIENALKGDWADARLAAEIGPDSVVDTASRIARLANGAAAAARAEAANSEDKTFVEPLEASANRVQKAITEMVGAAKSAAVRCYDSNTVADWHRANLQLIEAVANVANVLATPPNANSSLMQQVEIPTDTDEFVLVHQDRESGMSPAANDTTTTTYQSINPDDDFWNNIVSEPSCDEPILFAAQELRRAASHWQSRDNDLVAAAKRAAILMAKLSHLCGGASASKATKRELIDTSKALADSSDSVCRIAVRLAAACTDVKMRGNLLQCCERLPTLSTQLKILSTVKATMMGNQAKGVWSSEDDQQAMAALALNAHNLMNAIADTVRASESASIRSRADSGVRLRWVRTIPNV